VLVGPRGTVQLSQGALGDDLYASKVVEQRDFLLEKLLHGQTEVDPTSEVLLVNEAHFVAN